MNIEPKKIYEENLGKRFIVFTPTRIPYQGKLIGFDDKVLVFEGLDGKKKIFPVDLYDMEEQRNEQRTKKDY